MGVTAVWRGPKVAFLHAGGLKLGDNVGTYWANSDDAMYLAGMAAGAVSKSGKLGFAAAFPIPQVIRSINAFTLGAQAVTPKVTTRVVWTGGWLLPKEAEAANALIGAGVDVIGEQVDSPMTIAQKAEKRGVYAVGKDLDVSKLAPKAVLQGIPTVWLNWGVRADLLNIAPSLLHAHTQDGSGAGLGEFIPGGAPILREGSWGARIVDELDPGPTRDIHVTKHRFSGFWDTPLDSILRNMGLSTLLFAGVNADQCVMTTLQDASFLGYDVLMLRDCVGTTSPDYCMQATEYNVKLLFGFMTDSRALAAGLAASAPGGAA